MANQVQPTIIRVGLGSCGTAAGGLKVYDELKTAIESDGLPVLLKKTGCIGLCYEEPLVDVLRPGEEPVTYGHVTPERAQIILKEHALGGRPVKEWIVSGGEATTSATQAFLGKQRRIALRNCGQIDPEALEEYEAHGGYSALRRVLSSLTPEAVIEEIIASGLRGRGGAGFPTGLKWRFTRQASGQPKYIVCNADEGDPGAFMDRSVLEGDPHSVIEGMLIAAYAIGASAGYIYVRAEYPLAVKRLTGALEQARAAGYLGENILGSRFSFTLDIKQGAGAFVCGEETALLASLEGRRGMPRLKPPFPANSGLWQKPTCINNVETFANVPWIILNGAQAFAALGTAKSKGTKVFALAGKIARGGLVEVPMGISLREVIFDIGGGIRGGKEFKAVQLGGPSGGCIPAALLDTPVDYESITATGAIMGSGGMVVMDEDTCMVDMARFFLDFVQKESCGKCIACRLGTKRMLEILERITEGKGREEDMTTLQEVASKVKETALCGLGQTAPNPVLTTLRYFRHEYEAHIRDKKCPAHQCKALISFHILADACTGCGLCARVCPAGAISGERRQVHVIDQEKCVRCRSCYEACRFHAIKIE